jgi:two-component system cell cycle response regulator
MSSDRDKEKDHSIEEESETTGQISLSPDVKEMLREERAGKRGCFLVLKGLDRGNVIPLEDSVVVFGRSSKCNVVLVDQGVSRYHAEVLREESGRFTVRDLDSTNGTFVRGKKVFKAQLKEGDKVALGWGTVLKFMLQDEMERTYHKEMFECSTRDGLTGIYNRRYFIEKIGTELSYARRHRVPLTLILFDIDHFKKVNDTYGHQSGDRVLSTVANAFKGNIRKEDVFARYGGEEFVIIAQGIDFQGGRAYGERVRFLVAYKSIPAADGSGATIKVTVSVGAATVHPDAVVDSSKLIAVADKNLYRAKENGRNQVVASEVGLKSQQAGHRRGRGLKER